MIEESLGVQIPLLSILIPSRNRRTDVSALVTSLDKYLTDEQKNLCEIVISDNSDLPYRLKGVVDATSLRVKIIRPKSTLPTAEENLFYAWKYCKGEYIWTLGDDDPVNFQETPYLFKLLEQGKENLFFWNSNLISSTGKIIQKNRIPLKNADVIMPLRDFIARAGAWYAASGFSTWIIRNSYVKPEEAFEWFKHCQSAIYGHVTLYLKNFPEENVCVVNRPLVYYRINTYDESGDQSNWKNYAKETGKYFRRAWIYDFPRQIQELVEIGSCKPDFIGQIIEQNHSGERFPLLLILSDLLLEQIEISIGDRSEIIPLDHLAFILAILQEHIPSFVPWAEQLVRINRKLLQHQNSSKLIYFLTCRKFQADINIMRYNLFAARITEPFLDFKPNIVGVASKAEYQFVDYGLGTNYFYSSQELRNMAPLSTNINVLRMIQYFPFRFRRKIKTVGLRLLKLARIIRQGR